MISVSKTLTALVAVFLCLSVTLMSGCSTFHNPEQQPFSAELGVYKVRIVVGKDDNIRKNGRIAYFYKPSPTIVLPQTNTLECAAHEVGHALGWKHEESSYQYCKKWGAE